MQTVNTRLNTCLRRLMSHISPRRSRMERKSGYGIAVIDGLEHIAVMPNPVSMNKWRAR